MKISLNSGEHLYLFYSELLELAGTRVSQFGESARECRPLSGKIVSINFWIYSVYVL